MPPGLKKKGTSRKNVSNQKQDHNAPRDSALPDENSESASKTEENICNSWRNENQKYQRRKINSNSDRYEEPVVDTHANAPQGSDYEVLRSYSGGAGSQYRFLDEREWEANANDVHNLALDLNGLSQSLKQIPFYERLHLSKDIFEPRQIERMTALESIKPSHSSFENKKMDILPKAAPEMARVIPDLKLLEPEDGFAFKVAESEPDSAFIDIKQPVIPESTKRTIESLATRLASGAQQQRFKKPLTDEPAHDELNDLLSLCKPNRSSELKNTAISDADIDDFLNSILED